MVGFVWLGVGGALLFLYGAQYAGVLYDAVLHAVFVGFVMSMVFGHAPVIFPGVLGVPVPYTVGFYVPLGILHVTLFLRIAGDVGGWAELRFLGGLGNGVAIGVFLGLVGFSLLRRSGSPKSGLRAY